VRQALFVGCAVACFLVLNARERRADHDRACPASLADLVSGGYLHQVPRDAWGRPLRVACPGRIDPAGFDVSSDGPDGEPGGRDRVQ
jgi:general secretion pathway protein G